MGRVLASKVAKQMDSNQSVPSPRKESSNLPSQSSSFGFSIFAFAFGFTILFLFFMSFLSPGVYLPQGIGGKKALKGAPGEKAFDLSTVKEPWIFTLEMSKEGERSYKTNCAFCHGDKGLGDGVAGKGLQPPPRNLVEGKWKYGGKSVSLFKIITQGVPNTSMASYSSLGPAERWGLVHFIRSITQNKVEDDPDELASFGREVQE